MTSLFVFAQTTFLCSFLYVKAKGGPTPDGFCLVAN